MNTVIRSGRASGLDLYSLHASIRAVLDFLDKVDPDAARRARYRSLTLGISVRIHKQAGASWPGHQADYSFSVLFRP
jgi:erythromycin esterase-like protein